MRPGWNLAAALMLSACAEAEPRSQWLVHVGTDAAVPAFGDRVRVDVLDAEGHVCAECQRTFNADELPLSFGVAPSGDSRLRLRLTLYRAAVIDDEGQPQAPVIELLAALPELASGETSVVAPLMMQCFGARSSESDGASCDPASGARGADLVLSEGVAADLPVPGSFGGEPASCGAGEPDMVCVPGAAYLMGSAVFVPLGSDFDPAPEQLVSVSSFWLDRDEVTVAGMRQIVKKYDIDAPTLRSDQRPYCTYTSAGEGDGLPVNCLSRGLAAEACEAVGKRLPTEAEWELAASGSSLDSPYPWSLTDVTNEGLCHQAVLARPTISEALEMGSRQCIEVDSALPVGLQAVAETQDEGHWGLRNLGGNVSEWVADSHLPFTDDACWGASVQLRDDPMCAAESPLGVTKGGDYVFFTYNSHSFFRRAVSTNAEFPFIGFRCAKDSN